MRLILGFEVKSNKQEEVMAIGKAITEHLQTVHDELGLVTVEYVWDAVKPAKQMPIVIPEKPNGEMKQNGKPAIKQNGKPKSVRDEGFIPEPELQASKRFRNGK